jgi:hypothetical protein
MGPPPGSARRSSSSAQIRVIAAWASAGRRFQMVVAGDAMAVLR